MLKGNVLRKLRAALRRAASDARGVALQTVIVIVVLLMIAGGVSAVLLTRSSDVVGQLEAQGIGALTEASCAITEVGNTPGRAVSLSTATPPVLASTTPDHCAWPVENITAAQCFAAGNGTLRAVAAITANALGGTHSAIAAGTDLCIAELTS